jgi:peptidoglycan hydrolase-like protein with peptidoglycan-binding domain
VAGPRARRLFGCALAAAALALSACGGGSDDESRTASTTTPAEETATEATTTETAPTGGGEETVANTAIYFTRGEQFRKVDAGVPSGSGGVEPAAELLFEGPPEGAKAQTQIPGGAELEGVSVDGGTATVEVSPEFLDGIPAGAADRNDAERQELAARLGQLTYTLTQFEGVDDVEVVAGGETVGRDADRADFAKPEQGPQRKQRPDGDRSSGTRELQERLAKLQYLPRSAVDGEYGYRTQQAVMAFQSWEGLARDGVVGPQTRAALAKAKAPKPGNSGPARRVEVHRAKGVALLIANGRVKRAIHTSSGAPATPTPAGTFQVFRKELKSWSVPFQVWLPYASYFTGGIAFHEYPDVPPFPASHGCVRVPAPEAQIVYRFAKLGTTVVVY